MKSKIIIKLVAIICIILAIFLGYISFDICKEMSNEFADKKFLEFILHILALIFTSTYTLIFGVVGVGTWVSKPIDKNND